MGLKLSLRRCFLIVVAISILLIFIINYRESQNWHRKIFNNVDSSSHNSSKTKLDNQIITTANSKLRITNKNNNDNDNQDSLTTVSQTKDPPNNIITNELLENTRINSDKIDGKPWFFSNGNIYPNPARINKKTKKRIAKLFPHEDRHDRITNQLMFVPPNYEEIQQSMKLKTILLYNGLGTWNVKAGRSLFVKSKCPVDTCTVTPNRDNAKTADLILYKDHYIPTGINKHARQLYMMYFLECPWHTQHVKFPDVFNWTATYRTDSDLVAPYEKFQYYNPEIRQVEQDRNYAQNKTKKVAWFVSNCSARNNRLAYAKELSKYIQVDIYGACGNFKCSRNHAKQCFEMLDKEYKFYLAFENSNCRDYITEKVYSNALMRNILPIVMGARPEDYAASAPFNSYIHVDEFGSPAELAEYLKLLDTNDDLYNSYFKWKGSGEFINTYFWCRLCAILHDEHSISKPKWYEDINEWWRGQKGICTNNSWRDFQARSDIISDDD